MKPLVEHNLENLDCSDLASKEYRWKIIIMKSGAGVVIMSMIMMESTNEEQRHPHFAATMPTMPKLPTL